MNSSKASRFWTLMVSVLVTIFSLGCGQAEDPNAASFEEDAADTEEQAEEKFVAESHDTHETWWVFVDEEEPRRYGVETGGAWWEATTVVYICLPPDSEGVIYHGVATNPPPACSTTPCAGMTGPSDVDKTVTVTVDDTWLCLEAEPLPEE